MPDDPRLPAHGDHPLRRPGLDHRDGGATRPEVVFELGVPILGICYGEQTICAQLGGKVEIGQHREFGRAFIEVVDRCALFEGLFEPGARAQVWMSHGDKVVELPPGFRVVATSEASPFAAIADDVRKFYGVQFHPEVVHTPEGGALLRNFTHRVAGCRGDWTMARFRETAIARIREQVGSGRVICGLSGGSISAVTALLVHEAIGEQLTCILVDTGLLRAGEALEVLELFRGASTSSSISRTRRTCSSSASPASATPSRSGRSSAGLSSMSSKRKPKDWEKPNFWLRERSIRTSSNWSRSRARASRSSRTTTSAACRRA